MALKVRSQAQAEAISVMAAALSQKDGMEAAKLNVAREVRLIRVFILSSIIIHRCFVVHSHVWRNGTEE